MLSVQRLKAVPARIAEKPVHDRGIRLFLADEGDQILQGQNHEGKEPCLSSADLWRLHLRQASVTLYTGDDVYHEKLSTNGALAIQAEYFGNVILGGEQPHTLEQITKHVYVIDEILGSISEKP